jgi:hypothetical protein
MKFGHRHIVYILGAFVLLVLLQAFGEIINVKLQNQLFAHWLNSGALVTNILGVMVGLYNIYQGLQYRRTHKLWILFFWLGVSCIFVNVLALTR